MLTEMWCSAFKDGMGEPRQPIQFHRGLNVVSGSYGASSSVGKSTFLMSIDFVFGGDDYINKLEDVVHRHVQPHEFSFAFAFDGERFCFRRTTLEHERIFLCNEKFVPLMQEPWTIDEYRDWLYEKYGLPTDNPEERSHISRFFRIYHRGNVSEKRPLTYAGGSKDTAIDCLMQLLGEPSLQYAKDELKLSKDRWDVYKKAAKYRFIPNTGEEDGETLKHNQDEMTRLEETLQALVTREPAQLEALNIIHDNERAVAALKSRLTFVRQRRGQLETQITVIRRNIEAQREERFTESFDELLAFFPNANKALFERVEGFHVQLGAFLTQESTDVLARFTAEFENVSAEIAAIEADITKLGERDKAAEGFAEEYYRLKTDIESLKRQSESFKLLIELKNEYDKQRERKKRLEAARQSKLGEASSRVTHRMWDINDEICGEKQSAPDLALKSLNEYEFRTFNDGGTSAQYRGLVVFDMAILTLTRLPAVAHDFVVLNNIDIAQRERVFAYYAARTDKQIFVALDEEDTYSEPTKALLGKATVLTLTTIGDNVLYGKTWNTKEQQLAAIQMTLDDMPQAHADDEIDDTEIDEDNLESDEDLDDDDE